MSEIETPEEGSIIEYEGEGIFCQFYSAGTRNKRGRLEVKSQLPCGDFYPAGFVLRWRSPGETEWRL